MLNLIFGHFTLRPSRSSKDFVSSGHLRPFVMYGSKCWAMKRWIACGGDENDKMDVWVD